MTNLLDKLWRLLYSVDKSSMDKPDRKGIDMESNTRMESSEQNEPMVNNPCKRCPDYYGEGKGCSGECNRDRRNREVDWQYGNGRRYE